MANHTASFEFEGFNKSKEKNTDIKISKHRLVMPEESVHELIEKNRKDGKNNARIDKTKLYIEK